MRQKKSSTTDTIWLTVLLLAVSLAGLGAASSAQSVPKAREVQRQSKQAVRLRVATQKQLGRLGRQAGSPGRRHRVHRQGAQAGHRPAGQGPGLSGRTKGQGGRTAAPPGRDGAHPRAVGALPGSGDGPPGHRGGSRPALPGERAGQAFGLAKAHPQRLRRFPGQKNQQPA